MCSRVTHLEEEVKQAENEKYTMLVSKETVATTFLTSAAQRM